LLLLLLQFNLFDGRQKNLSLLNLEECPHFALRKIQEFTVNTFLFGCWMSATIILGPVTTAAHNPPIPSATHVDGLPLQDCERLFAKRHPTPTSNSRAKPP
jgi:hypothetical protein